MFVSNNVILLNIIETIGLQYEHIIPGYLINLCTSMHIINWDVHRYSLYMKNPIIDELKKRIDAEKYSSFGNFHSRVLKPAIYDIDDYTDIMVEYKLIKSGKTVEMIAFKVRDKDERDYTTTHIMRERKIDTERRKETREKRKEMEERRRNRKKETIEGEGMITAQMTLEELIEKLESME